jgi:hypothetical protein
MRNAIQRLALLPIVTLFLLPVACHRTDRRAEALLNNADSLLTANPDSALRLLEALPATAEFTHRESARYALLLAQATDKCEKPLLPCDSLLDVALDYYDDDERERAVALLYKGRLEVEMEQSERAISFLLEGLNIIEKHPEDVETKRHLLSSLGNEYYDVRLYEKTRKVYKDLYECCFTDKDKAIALNGIGSYYSIIGKEDSALLYKKKALDYAQISKDSTIIEMFAGNLSREFCWKEKYDTALYYAKKSLQWLPQRAKRHMHYSNIGNIFYYKDNLDSAVYYMNKSLKDSILFNLKEKSSVLLKLSYIKEEQEDYQATTELLYQFIDIADSVYFTEQSTKIQQLVHQYDIKQKVDQEQRRSKYLLRNVIGTFLILCLVLIVFFQYRINKRDKQRVINEQKLAQAQEKYNNLKYSINESQHIITLLRKEQSDFSQEAEKYRQEITERETAIERLKAEKESLRTWLFKQSSIYQKVEKLSKQKVTSKKELTVLTNHEQKVLKEVVMELYADYISDTQTQYPQLTDEDLLYLCLEKVGFSYQTIALCFGNTNTHVVAQRKYRIKERMNESK